MRLQYFATIALAFTLVAGTAPAQTSPAMVPATSVRAGGILTPAETTKILPATVFFQGQSASVQGRNSAGIHLPGQGLLLVSLIDTSGYSSQVQSKYQAYLIVEAPVEIGGHPLPAGAYGCGFLANNQFIVMDIGGHDLFTAASTSDAALSRPKPLQILADQGKPGSYRLYAGRSYVTVRTSPTP
jgi:hypothetical protein